MWIKSEFGRNVGKMMGGTGIAQIINFLGALVLARLYTEADFGRLALFASLMMMLTGVAGLRYELAIVLPKKKREAFPVLALALFANVFFAIFALLLLVFLEAPISRWFQVEELGKIIYAAPLGIFLLSTFNTLYNWHVRQKAFGYLARVQVGQTIAGLLAQICFSFALPAIGLIIGLLVRLGTGFLLIAKKFIPDFATFRKSLNRSKLKTSAREYREFPLVNAPHVGVDLLQNEGIIFLLAYFFSAALVGSYAFALRIVKAPLGLIGKAITPVFYQKAAELYRDQPQQLPILVQDIYKRLLLIGIPGFGVLFIFAPSLFALIFGENWREAGHIARILCPWLLLNFLANPISQLPLVLGQQRQAFLLAILGLFLKLGALLLAGWQGVDEINTFIYFSIGASIYQSIVVVWYYWISKNKTG